MKKVFKIILVLLFIILVILLGAWFFARREAVKEGGTAPTFRQFIGLGTSRTSPPASQGDGLTPDTPEVPEPQTPSPTTPGVGSVTVSEFTDAPLTPAQQVGGNEGNSTSPGSSSGGGNTTPLTPTPPPSSAPLTVQAGSCSDEDMNIAFTPEEIARLRELQNRFYTVAGALRSDAAVAAELSNYNTFRAKADTITELYAYCAAKSPLIASPALQTRVATPFWRDPSKDREGYMPITMPNFGSLALQFFNSGPIDPRNVPRTQIVIQKIFKLNLW